MYNKFQIVDFDTPDYYPCNWRKGSLVYFNTCVGFLCEYTKSITVSPLLSNTASQNLTMDSEKYFLRLCCTVWHGVGGYVFGHISTSVHSCPKIAAVTDGVTDYKCFSLLS